MGNFSEQVWGDSRERRQRALLALVLGLGVVALSPTLADAAPEAYGINAPLGTGSTWLGSYNLDGQLVICAAQSGPAAPDLNTANNFAPVVWLDGNAGHSWTGT